jgi:hypothetical protein
MTIEAWNLLRITASNWPLKSKGERKNSKVEKRGQMKSHISILIWDFFI